ncbi:PREDICTED: DNA polymerase alpha subunit B-like isoform X2 [Priapulus caudatus]|uniref:DNA polymerase alpha subunit B n=1 Tax=Priapulus caudatus TaxID=37621 RepID=A0ABM1DPG6_PRICU|nr:PREDICTED: DNA polymerase alpha subunit B-like isoform X2 [Priapulus caudatus]
MEVSSNTIIEEFDVIGVTIATSGSENDVDKLRELMVLHHLDIDSLVNEWGAFEMTQGGIELSQETLAQFEQYLNNNSKKTPKTLKLPPKKNSYSAKKSGNISLLAERVARDSSEASELIDAYSTPVAKSKNKRQITPDNRINKRLASVNGSPAVPFSPASFSPTTPSTGKYSTRRNPGQVIATFGDSKSVTWASDNQHPCSVKPYGERGVLETDKYSFMMEKIVDRVNVMDNILDDIGDRIKECHGVENLSPVNLQSAEPSTVLGRVYCDSVGRLNARSVVLRGDIDVSGRAAAPMQLDKLTSYSLFPGQVALFEGMNSTGRSFVPTTLLDTPTLTAPAARDATLKRLSVVMASGPYMTSDSLGYEPLADFVSYLQSHPPDVCIMFGPFVDAKSELIKDLSDVTYEQHFTKILEVIGQAVENLPLKVVLVPSQRDIHHPGIYPMPPFNIGKLNRELQKRFYCVSDPSTLNIDGLCVGLTSTDVLFHMGAEEINLQPKTADRLSRLTEHLLQQGSYYPLNPPSEELNVNYEKYEVYSRMSCTPHLLLLPSELKQYTKSINGCLCVNPGRLSKGQTGGTYARILVQSDSSAKAGFTTVAEVVRI